MKMQNFYSKPQLSRNDDQFYNGADPAVAVPFSVESTSTTREPGMSGLHSRITVLGPCGICEDSTGSEH